MASQEANEKNILAIKAHAEESRSRVNAQGITIENHINTITTLTSRIDQLENQLRMIQVRLFSGGATE